MESHKDVENFFEKEKGLTVDSAKIEGARYTAIDMCNFAQKYKSVEADVEPNRIDYILEETEDAYMRGDYTDNHWRQIAIFLLSITDATKEGVACIMNSKHMRWSSDFTGKTTFKSFVEYYNYDGGFNGALADLIKWSNNPY